MWIAGPSTCPLEIAPQDLDMARCIKIASEDAKCSTECRMKMPAVNLNNGLWAPAQSPI
jgi:hypothetical protein